MKINLADIFCEVLSGLALFLNIIPLLDILDLATISKSLTYVSSKMTLSNVTVFVVACYVLGLLIDAVGLAFDRIFSFVLEDKSPPSYTQRSNYWKSVTPQVLAYRDTQWAYYSCYRNLIVVGIPGGILWTISAWGAHWYCGAGAALLFIILLLSLMYSMTVLLNIYYEIPKRF